VPPPPHAVIAGLGARSDDAPPPYAISIGDGICMYADTDSIFPAKSCGDGAVRSAVACATTAEAVNKSVGCGHTSAAKI